MDLKFNFKCNFLNKNKDTTFFTMITAYRLDLKSTIIAEKAQNLSIFCTKSYSQATKI